MSSSPLIRDLSKSLDQLITRELPVLRAMPEADAVVRPGGETTWSPKEELGHLIDSAANNHARFVRALIEPEFRGPGYAQDAWVRVHRYQEMPWAAIIDFWFYYNEFLAGTLSAVPETKLGTLCYIGSDAGVTLQFLVDDYVLHMQHHVDHLLLREHVTAYPAPVLR